MSRKKLWFLLVALSVLASLFLGFSDKQALEASAAAESLGSSYLPLLMRSGVTTPGGKLAISGDGRYLAFYEPALADFLILDLETGESRTPPLIHGDAPQFGWAGHILVVVYLPDSGVPCAVIAGYNIITEEDDLL